MKKFFPFLLILGVLVIAIVGGFVLYTAQSAGGGNNSSGAIVTGGSNNTGSNTPASPRVLSPGATPAHERGDTNAPVKLEEFGDFQCPVCARFYKDLKQIEAEFGESKLCVTFREYPIQQLHPHALEAARAAEAAGLQNRFWEMHDLLYENQDTWVKENDPRASFIGYAKSLGLDLQKFNGDLDGNIAASRSLDDQRRARDMGVTGTPTIFINGKPPRDRNIDSIRAAINEALKEKGY
jgi:protein-disulfide isomerase